MNQNAHTFFCPSCSKEQSAEEWYCNQCGSALLQGKTVGSYQIHDLIGSGGMGAVYKAIHTKLGTPFAIKILHSLGKQKELFTKRFLQEAKLTAQLRHEHIVFIADYGEIAPLGPYLVMEHLEGKTLDAVIEKEGVFTIPRTLSIALQICKTMQYSHEKGVIHRDLKPENIFLLERNHESTDFLKILDFGIAKLFESSEEQLTKTGSVLGTPSYMAPEQALGEPISQQTDIYALGVILFRLLTGRLPFVGNSAMEIIGQSLYHDLPLLSSVHPHYKGSSLEKIVSDCMAREPSQRPASMQELKIRLEKEVQPVWMETLHMQKQPPGLDSSLPSGFYPESEEKKQELVFSHQEVEKQVPEDSLVLEGKTSNGWIYKVFAMVLVVGILVKMSSLFLPSSLSQNKGFKTTFVSQSNTKEKKEAIQEILPDSPKEKKDVLPDKEVPERIVLKDKNRRIYRGKRKKTLLQPKKQKAAVLLPTPPKKEPKKVAIALKQPSDGCPANQEGEKWIVFRVLLKDKSNQSLNLFGKALVSIRRGKRMLNRKQKVWCVAFLQNRPLEIEVKSLKSGLATCFFTLPSQQYQRKLHVFLLDDEDQDEGSYCFRSAR